MIIPTTKDRFANNPHDVTQHFMIQPILSLPKEQLQCFTNMKQIKLTAS